jgi:hypothetical protein
MKKQRLATCQAESNVQMLIDQCFDIMPHQMKGIGNGMQDVRLLILDLWNNIHEQSNEV